jgi:hypothetical protein
MSVGRGVSLMGCVTRPSRLADGVTIFSRLLDRPDFAGSRPKTTRMKVPDKTQDPSSSVFSSQSSSPTRHRRGRARAGERQRRSAAMGFISFVGRVLFASLFLLSAYQEYAPLPHPLPSDPRLLSSLPCRFIRAPILSTISLDGGGHVDLVPPIRVLVGWIESFTLR